MVANSILAISCDPVATAPGTDLILKIPTWRRWEHQSTPELSEARPTRVNYRTREMAFGFIHPRYAETRALMIAPDELLSALKSAVESLGWTDQGTSENEIKARVPWSAFVWDHDVTISILSNSTVRAESRSTYKENFYDFGRNKKYVEQLFARVEQMTGTQSRKIS
jgi:hypothetical protein